MKNPICMIVVTFNRKDLLLRNIVAARLQSVPVDILIFDNHSMDGTFEYLCEKEVLPAENITYHYAESNCGGAGGFSEGLKIAYEMGYSFFWLMDDDGYCYNENTLSNLLDRKPDDTDAFIMNSTVICSDEKELTFGFPEIETYEKLVFASENGVFKGYINPFNGTLISKGCIDKIGFPIGEFFLYGDEHEYMLRALKNGIKVETVIDSLYYHPVNRPIEYKKVGRYLVPVKSEPVWKSFCDARNSIYISKRYESKKMLLIRAYCLVMAAVIKPEKKLRYLHYSLLGINDGLKGNLSRKPMFDK